jgi:UreD-like urease accessory protein/molybdopterin-dependent oxidoreductase-like protein protein
VAEITRGFVGRRTPDRDGRLPPGQYDVGDEWPVLTAEVTPRLDTDTWTLTVEGLVDRPMTWTWDEIHALPGSAYSGDIHCVTTWSKFDVQFGGVSLDTLLEIARPLPTATHVLAFCHTGYTTAAPGAVLEYLPDPVVPCRGSRLFQTLSVTADRDSTVILAETLLPGRVAHGEAHVYDLYWSETEVRRPDGTLLFADVLRLNPAGGRHPKSIGLCGPHDVIASLYVITARIGPPALVGMLRAVLATAPEVVAGVSELPNGCGIVVRALGRSSKAVQAAVVAAWNEARLALLGAPAPDLRKG